MDAVPRPLLRRLRRICASLPEAVEAEGSAADATFKVGRRTFLNVVTVAAPDGQPVTVITARASEADLIALATSGHPFFRPRSANACGWLGVVLDDDTDWTEVAEIVADSYRAVAPRRLTERLP